MSRITRLSLVFMLAALLLGPLTSANPVSAQTQSASPKGVSPARMLNPDGTLALDGHFSGALDLSGYNVQMDPVRGPIFAPASGRTASPQAVVAPAGGQWASLGGGLQALNDAVNAIAVNGSDVYIGGYFTDADGIPAADHIVKWNGSTWSALGSNGAGDGSLGDDVNAIAVIGSDVYVGGGFSDVNNNGTVLTAADKVAKWDGANWSALGNNGAEDGSINNWVNAFAVIGTDLYVGGNFTDVNNNGTVLVAADHIAKWDGAHWSALGNNAAGNGSVPNPVLALAVMGTDLFVGGTFGSVNNNGMPVNAAAGLAKWDGANWSALGSNGAGGGALNNSVYALAVSGTYLYVGGNFTNVHNGIVALPSADYIARWDGALWSTLGTGASDGALNSWVNAIVVNGSYVYAGGNFYDVNNKGTPLPAADYVAKFATSTRAGANNWSALGSNDTGDGSLFNDVLAMALYGSTVLMGGSFGYVSNNSVALSASAYIASWDGLNWSAPAATNPSGALSSYLYNPYVFAVAVQGTNVYVGGSFMNVENGAALLPAADYIAKWDGSNWTALGSNGAGDGSLNGTVDALAVSGSNLYVGGTFTDVDNNGTVLTAADKVAKWDGSNWSALGNNGAGGGSIAGGIIVYALAVSGSNLYVGGSFTDVNNYGTVLTSADYVARWDGSNWFSLLGDGVSNGSLNNAVYALAVSGSNVYVGGGFTNVNNGGTVLPAADRIAKWDGSNWSALGGNGSGDGSLSANVLAIAVSGANVYVGGNFTNVTNNGVVLNAADYIAKWDGSNWSALGRNGAGNGSFNNFVAAIAVVGADIYVGGQFQNLDNKGTVLPAADFIAKWNGTDWSALGSNGAGAGPLNNNANAFAVAGTNLYVGGMFTDASNNGTRVTAGDYIVAYGLGPHLVYLPLIRR